MLNWIVWNRTIFIKLDLALNNLQRLISHKTQPTIQPTSQPIPPSLSLSLCATPQTFLTFFPFLVVFVSLTLSILSHVFSVYIFFIYSLSLSRFSFSHSPSPFSDFFLFSICFYLYFFFVFPPSHVFLVDIFFHISLFSFRINSQPLSVIIQKLNSNRHCTCVFVWVHFQCFSFHCFWVYRFCLA